MISSPEMVWLVETKRLPTGKSSNARFTWKHCCIAGADASSKLYLTRQYDRTGIEGDGYCPAPGKLELRWVVRRTGDRPMGSLVYAKSAVQMGFRLRKGSIAHSIVFLQELPHSIVRQCFDPVTVAASHVLIVDQRIDDRFLDGLHGRFEDRVEQIVRHGLHRLRRLFRIARAGVGGRES